MSHDMGVTLIVDDNGVRKSDGREVILDTFYPIPGFWFKVSKQGSRLIAILIHGTIGHTVYEGDVTQYGLHMVEPYGNRLPLLLQV